MIVEFLADETLFCLCQLLAVPWTVSLSPCGAFSIRGPLVPASRWQHPAFPLTLSPPARSRRFCCHSPCCTEFLGGRTSLLFLRVVGFLVTAPLVAPKRMLSLTTSLAAFPPRLLAPPFRRAVVSCSRLCASISRWRQPSGHGSERFKVAGGPVALSLALPDGRVLQGWAGGARRSSEPVTGELHGHSLFPAPPHGFRLGLQNAVPWRRLCASLSQDPAVSRVVRWLLGPSEFRFRGAWDFYPVSK